MATENTTEAIYIPSVFSSQRLNDIAATLTACCFSFKVFSIVILHFQPFCFAANIVLVVFILVSILVVIIIIIIIIISFFFIPIMA